MGLEPSCATSHSPDDTFKFLLGDRWSADMDYRIEPERRVKWLEAEGWERLVFYSGDSYVVGRKAIPKAPAPTVTHVKKGWLKR